MTTPHPGVLRRSARAGEVVERLDKPISFFRPVRSKGQFIVDALVEADREIKERKYLANRLRPR